MDSQTDQKVVLRLVRETDLLTTKNSTMQKSEVLEVKLKACRPRFKAGSELTGRVNKIILNIDQVLEDENECLDIDLKWEVTGEGLDCE